VTEAAIVITEIVNTRYNQLVPSIQDVAERAGVSVTTVSRTFCAPEKLKPATIEHVVEVARQMGYQPRGRRPTRPVVDTSKAITLGFQFFADRPEDPLQANTFYAPMLFGAQAEAADRGLQIQVNTANRHSVMRELPPMIQRRAVAGMILVGAGADADTLARFARYVPNLVLLDQYDEAWHYESVLSDGFDGAYQATNYLLSLGHTRIAFFLSESSVNTFRDRCHGYLAAIFAAGLRIDPSLVAIGSFDDADEVREGRLAALLQAPSPPTALIAPNDDYAFSTMRTLRRWGVRIPEDLSLVGFDDIPFGAQSDPPLTTVHVDKELMGRLAVRRLCAQIQAGESSHPEPCGRYYAPVSLIVRGSCHPL